MNKTAMKRMKFITNCTNDQQQMYIYSTAKTNYDFSLSFSLSSCPRVRPVWDLVYIYM